MREFWKKLRHDCKGAVTVFVTLLLIPMVLVSGSGVDLARIYAAKSILHDANQLGANAVLTQYDALLQDVYGLFGIMSKDKELATLVSGYLETAVFGEDWKDKSLGSFQLFYGSELKNSGVIPAAGKNLGNPEVLRRQIEEYAKLRAPVIIVDKILDTLDKLKQVSQDADAIQTKIEIDDKIEDIDDLYHDFYKKINDANKYRDDELEAYNALNDALDEVDDQLEALFAVRESYGELARASKEEDAFISEKLEDAETHYADILENIRKTIRGGKLKKGWHSGGINDDGEWEKGYWGSTSGTLAGIDRAKAKVKDAVGAYESKLDKLIDKAEEIDREKAELNALLDQLINQLQTCSSEMRTAMMEEKDQNGRTTIENYRILLDFSVTAMATEMKAVNWPHITDVKNAMDSFTYGDQSGNPAGRISLDTLSNISESTPGFNIDFATYDIQGNWSEVDKLDLFQALSEDQYHARIPGGNTAYKLFNDSRFGPTKNIEFYQQLQKMYGVDADEVTKKNAKKLITSIYESIQDMMQGFNVIPTEGALFYLSSTEEAGDVFGMDGDWAEDGVGQDKTKEALDSSILASLGNLLGEAADKILLLTYDTEMFSCWSVKEGDETMSGIPLSTEMNYFYQSEQEYLFGGSKVASVNLLEVAGTLLLIRFVFNYVASFVIEEVENVVAMIKTALSWLGPIGIGIGELARAAIALGESVIDVGRLRAGDEDVALFKGTPQTEEDWRLSLTNLTASALNDINGINIKGQLADAAGTDSARSAPSYVALTYQDYLRIFLLLKDGDTLANRTIDLIQFNMTNYTRGLNADEAAMISAEKYNMADMMTDFSITTTVDMKMLFLSMPFARNGIDGVIPPETLRLSVTDYRGY